MKHFTSYRRNDLKILHGLKMDDQTHFSDRLMNRKIIKLDENNEYGYTMTKQLTTRCYKNIKEISSLKEFNRMIDDVNLEDKTRHIMMIDIKFQKARFL